jgi:AcrR family transcriptional regulator
MQERNQRRSNPERTAATRADLIAAARTLFVERGYADTGTPDIVAAAGVTRGALYHHFEDKKALFRAVVENEAASVADEIDRAAPESLGARGALVKGGEAFLAAMAGQGRTRLLLVDAPAVLGRAEMAAIDGRHGTRSLKAGIVFAVRSGLLPKGTQVDALTDLLSAAYDRAALAIDAGAAAAPYRRALQALVEGVTKDA